MADFDITLTFAAGEDATFEVEIEDDAGADLTGNAFEYCVYDGGRSSIFALADGQIARASGALRIVIPRATTSDLCVGGTYYHNLWMMDGPYRRQIGAGVVTVTEGQPR